MQAPINLSTLPGCSRVESIREHVTAFLGRCSTKDRQNPATSIPGQAAVCMVRLDPGKEAFDTYYWDVESGYMDLDERSRHDDDYYTAMDVPLRRDGGINELLAAVQEGRITRVICEQSDRAARDMLAILTVETFLDKHGVELVYATEPPSQRAGALSASELQMRRSGQMQAEVYGRIRQENSDRGQRQHTVEGWTHGTAPYPYTTVVDTEAPEPSDRFLHRPKRRLARHPDTRRWDAVTLMADLRLRERADYRDIRAVLNAAPDRYPYGPGQWTVSRIRALLLNPRLTGYAVYNRRCNTNGWKPNPISEWTWSRTQSHPAEFTVENWAEFMRMEAASKAATDPLERLREGAAQRGLTVALVRTDDVHAVYAVGDRRFTVPAGDLPNAAVDRILTWLEAS
jgi:DNA invertase Pin-like site-specific DNA recombinase